MASAVFNAVLLAHEAADLEAFHCQLKPQDLDEGRQGFIVLGRFDHLLLQVSDSAQPLGIDMAAAGNARSAISCSYTGHMIAPEVFQPALWVTTHPLLGFCSLRLARRALKDAQGFDFLQLFLHDTFPDDGDVKWALASTSGWEDVVVLLFGRSFNDIEQAVGKLRGLNAKSACLPCPLDTEDGFHHLVLTSCTLPALACKWHRQWQVQDTEALLDPIKASEPIGWAVRVEVYPGHWDACASLLQHMCAEAGLAVNIAPLFRQADLRVSPADDSASSHRGLVTLLTQVIFPLEAMEHTVVRTVQTRLIPRFSGYAEDAGAGHHSTRRVKPMGPDLVQLFSQQSKRALDEMAAPPHTLNALEETMSRIQSMARDRLHGEEFHTLHRLATAFNNAVIKAPSKASPTDAHYDDQVRDLLQDISDWQLHVERCVADRFRGPYPAGDSMMVRISSHPGTHHRFLVVMDHFAQKACDLARTRINEKLGVAALPKAALATFIGNSPSAYATSHMINRLHCGFTDLPAALVHHIRDCHLVAHETGHHVIRAFFSVYPDFEPFNYRRSGLNHAAVDKLAAAGCANPDILFLKERIFCDWRTLREMRELLADLFAVHLCFPGDHQAHDQASARTVGAFYNFAPDTAPSSVFMRSLMSEFRLRHLAIAALLDVREQPVIAYRTQATSFIEFLKQSASIPLEGSKLSRLQQCSDRIGDALRALIVLRNVKEIGALLDGFAACATTPHFIGEDLPDSFIKVFRDFLSDPPSSTPAANFAILDRLWFIVLRRQDGLLS